MTHINMPTTYDGAPRDEVEATFRIRIAELIKERDEAIILAQLIQDRFNLSVENAYREGWDDCCHDDPLLDSHFEQSTVDQWWRDSLACAALEKT